MTIRDVIALSSTAFLVAGAGMIYLPLGFLATGAILGWICYQMPDNQNERVQ